MSEPIYILFSICYKHAVADLFEQTFIAYLNANNAMLLSIAKTEVPEMVAKLTSCLGLNPVIHSFITRS